MLLEEKRQTFVTANGNRVNLNGNVNGLNINNWNDNANSNIGVASVYHNKDILAKC